MSFYSYRVIEEQIKLRDNAIAQANLLTEYKKLFVYHPSHRNNTNNTKNKYRNIASKLIKELLYNNDHEFPVNKQQQLVKNLVMMIGDYKNNLTPIQFFFEEKYKKYVNKHDPYESYLRYSKRTK